MRGSFLADILLKVSGRGRALLKATSAAPVPKHQHLVFQCEQILSGRGEATELAIAQEVLKNYQRLDSGERATFFGDLNHKFGPNLEGIMPIVREFTADPTPDRASRLHFAAEPRRQELFRRLNRIPKGTESLVRMRADLLDLLTDHPELRSTDEDFKHLFSSWFNRGFLRLERIDWSTSAKLLEKIIRYEAVHEIHDWEALRRRLEPSDRRCYAFFHPSLGDEPLIFVEVALTTSPPRSIREILTDDRLVLEAQEATTAVFYSISNCQVGLKGVTFGSFLLKQVVDELANELPEIRSFVTLSPLPGFMNWLHKEGLATVAGAEDGHRQRLSDFLDENGGRPAEAPDEFREVLLKLAARYLLLAKNPRGEPLDAVARFHLGNGARIQRLVWAADDSRKGQLQSQGMMVSYEYVGSELEINHEAYANEGKIVASDEVIRTATKALPRK